MLDRLELFLYRRALNRYRSTNLHKIGEGHFDNLKTIGIVFDASQLAHHKTILKFRNDLQQRDKEVQLLGYFPVKEIVEHQPFGYFTLENVNFAHLPKGDIVRQFIAQPFDVLINMDPHGHRPISYICAASKALFKIGPGTADPRHFDLMIDMRDGFKMSKYIREIRNTFTQIN